MSHTPRRVEKFLNAASITFMAALIIGFAVFYVAREFHDYPFSSSAFFIYGVIALLALGLAMNRSKRILSGMIVMSTMVRLFFVNCVVELLMTSVPPQPELPDSFDKRTKYQVVRDFQRNGVDAAPHMCALHVYSPFRQEYPPIVRDAGTKELSIVTKRGLALIFSLTDMVSTIPTRSMTPLGLAKG